MHAVLKLMSMNIHDFIDGAVKLKEQLLMSDLDYRRFKRSLKAQKKTRC